MIKERKQSKTRLKYTKVVTRLRMTALKMQVNARLLIRDCQFLRRQKRMEAEAKVGPG
jgi:hypothetical protein